MAHGWFQVSAKAFSSYYRGTRIWYCTRYWIKYKSWNYFHIEICGHRNILQNAYQETGETNGNLSRYLVLLVFWRFTINNPLFEWKKCDAEITTEFLGYRRMVNEVFLLNLKPSRNWTAAIPINILKLMNLSKSPHGKEMVFNFSN